MHPPPSTQVEDWMSSPLITAPVGVTTEEIARLMTDRGIRHIPLLRADGRCAGGVCDADVFASGTFVGEGTWMESQSSDPVQLARPLGNVLHHNDELAYALSALVRTRSDHAMVLTGTGKPLGIFTEHDAVRAGAQLLHAELVLPRTAPLHAVPSTAAINEALSEMVGAGVRHLVVRDAGKLVGVVSFRDLVAADGSLTAGEVVPAGPLHTMPMGSPMRWAASQMASFKIGCLVEVDGEGAAVGIVSRSDIVAALMSLYDADEDTGAWEIEAREIDGSR